MAQLKGIFINAQTKAAFQERLSVGDVKLTQIAFIKDTKEIWTQGVYYKIEGLNEQQVVNLINEHGGGTTLDEFKTLLNQVNKSDFSSDVQNIFNKAESALQNDNIYNWALSNNNDKIPIDKLQDLLIPGYLSNNRFYGTKTGNTFGNEITPSDKKFYYDKDNNKLYVFQNNVFTQISGNDQEAPDLGIYLKASDAENIYATKENLEDAITNLINGAPAAYDTLKELSDALQNNSQGITDILSTLNNYYTKTEIENNYLTKTDASNTYVTKTEFEDYKATINNELTLIKNRLEALENMWSNVPTDEYHYYIGTDEITTSNYASHLNLNELPDTYTVDEFDKQIYIVFPESENITVTSGQFTATLVTIGTVDGYKIVKTNSEGGVYGTITINKN